MEIRRKWRWQKKSWHCLKVNEYAPNKWVVIKVANKAGVFHRVFGCWYGGFKDGDSWRINSGITNVTIDNDIYSFHGYTKSVYKCSLGLYGTNSYGGAVLNNFIKDAKKEGTVIEILPKDYNFLSIKGEVK